MNDRELEDFQRAIAAAFPHLAAAECELLPPGWDSRAVAAAGFVFKFPRSDAAAAALRREARLLQCVRPFLSLRVPDLELHRGPPLFSRHPMIPGRHLLPADYERLGDAARRRLAAQLARFFAELHALDQAMLRAAGATAIAPWLPPARIRAHALAAVPDALAGYVERTLAAFAALPPDPHGTTYGFFDGHGWNMAFDPAAGALNGIYDFADSGFGALHQEFVYPSFVSADLTLRVLADYEAITGRALDRRRIAILTATHRLFELAEAASDLEQVPEMLRHLDEWRAQEALLLAGPD